MKKSNCLFFVIILNYRRFKRLGYGHGYMAIRKSKFGYFPHFLYVRKGKNSLKMVSYVPIDPKSKICPPPLFSGMIKRGD